MATMKLGVTYSLFDGEELLPFSILSIRPHVDYINVVFQEHSWFGDKCTPLVRPMLADLKNKRMIDNIIEYPFRDFGNRQKMAWYVIEKKTLGLNELKQNGCTHCMMMDTDEFYFADEFAEAKRLIAEKHITHSACSIYQYRHFPELRFRDVSTLAVPFIFELRSDSVLTPFHNLPCYCDDLRALRFNPMRDKFYYFNSLCMHHMSGIRFDFDKKTRASFNNVTAEGHALMKNLTRDYNADAGLTKEQLLAMPQEKLASQNDVASGGGGYVDVGDPFNLNIQLQALKKSAEPLFRAQ